MSRSVLFGYALRQGMDEENPDNKKRSTGPGSYDYSQCYDSLSEYVKKEANRFPCAPRQSMALKTPSPGAVYNIDKQFYLGPEKHDGIGFPNSTRNDLFGRSTTANADMFIPKPETGPAITIAARPKQSNYKSRGTPGAIYDVHVSPLSFPSLLDYLLILSLFVSRKEWISGPGRRSPLEEEKEIDLVNLDFFRNLMICSQL